MRRFVASVSVAVVVLVGGALLAVYAWERFSARKTPEGQPPLVSLTDTNELREAFNAASDRTRILALLSPT